MFNKIITAVSIVLVASSITYAGACCVASGGTCCGGSKATLVTEVVKAQTTCPVMEGNLINKELYADVEGKRIYVCCGGCIAKIKEDPKKYITKLEAAGVVLEDAPKK